MKTPSPCFFELNCRSSPDCTDVVEGLARRLGNDLVFLNLRVPELIQKIQQKGGGMLLFGISTRQDLVDLTHVIRACQTQIHSGELRVFGYTKLALERIERVLKRLGVSDVFSLPISIKALLLKWDRHRAAWIHREGERIKDRESEQPSRVLNLPEAALEPYSVRLDQKDAELISHWAQRLSPPRLHLQIRVAELEKEAIRAIDCKLVDFFGSEITVKASQQLSFGPESILWFHLSFEDQQGQSASLLRARFLNASTTDANIGEFQLENLNPNLYQRIIQGFQTKQFDFDQFMNDARGIS